MYLCISILRRIFRQKSQYSTSAHKMKQNGLDSIYILRVLTMTIVVAFHSLLYCTGTWWQFGGLTVPIWVYLALYLTLENAFKLRTKKEKKIRLTSMLITSSEKDCIESYRNAIKQLINDNTYDNIIYINYESWNPKGDQDSRQIYTPDMIHLNEYGYSILDSCIAKEMQRSRL